MSTPSKRSGQHTNRKHISLAQSFTHTPSKSSSLKGALNLSLNHHPSTPSQKPSAPAQSNPPTPAQLPQTPPRKQPTPYELQFLTPGRSSSIPTQQPQAQTSIHSQQQSKKQQQAQPQSSGKSTAQAIPKSALPSVPPSSQPGSQPTKKKEEKKTPPAQKRAQQNTMNDIIDDDDDHDGDNDDDTPSIPPGKPPTKTAKVATINPKTSPAKSATKQTPVNKKPRALQDVRDALTRKLASDLNDTLKEITPSGSDLVHVSRFGRQVVLKNLSRLEIFAPGKPGREKPIRKKKNVARKLTITRPIVKSLVSGRPPVIDLVSDGDDGDDGDEVAGSDSKPVAAKKTPKDESTTPKIAKKAGSNIVTLNAGKAAKAGNIAKMHAAKKAKVAEKTTSKRVDSNSPSNSDDIGVIDLFDDSDDEIAPVPKKPTPMKTTPATKNSIAKQSSSPKKAASTKESASNKSDPNQLVQLPPPSLLPRRGTPANSSTPSKDLDFEFSDDEDLVIVDTVSPRKRKSKSQEVTTTQRTPGKHKSSPEQPAAVKKVTPKGKDAKERGKNKK